MVLTVEVDSDVAGLGAIIESIFMYVLAFVAEVGVVGVVDTVGVTTGGLSDDGESWPEDRDPGGVAGGRGCGIGDIGWGLPCCDATNVETFWTSARS